MSEGLLFFLVLSNAFWLLWVGFLTDSYFDLKRHMKYLMEKHERVEHGIGYGKYKIKDQEE